MVAPNSNSSHGHQGPPATRGIHPHDPAATPPQNCPQDSGLSSLTPRDSALLNALISSNFNLAKTAADHGLASTELLAWLNSPRIQSSAATLLHTSQTFLEIKLTRARMAVIDTLQEIALNHDSLTERRRAATALCRRMGAGALMDRTGIRRIGNPPPFTESRIPAARGEEAADRAGEAVQPPEPHANGPRPQTSIVNIPSHRHLNTPPTSAAPALARAAERQRRPHPSQDPDLADILAHPPALPIPDSGPSPDPRASTLELEGEGEAGSTVLPWPMPDSPDPDPPSRLAQVLFHAFTNRDLPRLAATFFHYATEDAMLDNRPLQEALPKHILAVMYRSREIAFVERSRSPNEATYTFSFERAPLIPSRASFRFFFTRARNDTWLIHQIDTLDTS